MTLADILPTLMGGTWPEGDDEVLNVLVRSHQALLPGDKIVTVVKSIPTRLYRDPRVMFLNAVNLYHAQRNAKGAEDWLGCMHAFSLVNPTPYPLLSFYGFNYKFLCQRNAGAAHRDGIWDVYHTVVDAAMRVEEPLQHQLLGFITYNGARLFLADGKRDEAKSLMQIAAKHRRNYLNALRAVGNASPDELLSARTQLWKIGADWTAADFFGPAAEHDNPVKPDEMAALDAEGIDPKFRASKK